MKRYIRSAKAYVKSPIDRFKSMIGISDWGNGPKLGDVTGWDSKDKYNYRIYDKYYDLSQDEIEEFTSRLKQAGAKYITKRRGELYFYYDLSKLDAEYQAEKQAAEEAYTAELNATDIDIYKPDQATIKKLIDYRDRGSKVNVKAIKDANKLLKYFYGACIIGWDDLAGDCRDILSFKDGYNKYDDILEAIRRRVQSDEQYSDTRTEFEQKYDLPATNGLFTFDGRDCWLPKSILMYFINNNIPVHFGKRTSGAQWDRNGRQWSEVEHLTLFPDSDSPIEYDIVVHTDEGFNRSDRYTGFGPNGRTDERISAKQLLSDIDRLIN